MATSPIELNWISVCAGCGRIYGSQSWRKAMRGELSNVEITHDICPDCIRLLYPNYAQVADRLMQQNIKNQTY